MRVAQKIAGYSLAEADLLRKAMGKKSREVIATERAKFVDAAESTGYGSVLGKQLFDIIEPFADYAFNKSHAAGYGLVSYWTAYLKANYPAEYMAGLLTSVGDDKDKAAVYLADCRKLLDENSRFLVLTVYAVRMSALAIGELVKQTFADLGGTVELGEMSVREEARGLLLPTAIFARWSKF